MISEEQKSSVEKLKLQQEAVTTLICIWRRRQHCHEVKAKTFPDRRQIHTFLDFIFVNLHLWSQVSRSSWFFAAEHWGEPYADWKLVMSDTMVCISSISFSQTDHWRSLYSLDSCEELSTPGDCQISESWTLLEDSGDPWKHLGL